jgi:hypothetical protein
MPTPGPSPVPEATGVLSAQVRACLPAKPIPVSDALGSPPSEPLDSRRARHSHGCEPEPGLVDFGSGIDAGGAVGTSIMLSAAGTLVLPPARWSFCRGPGPWPSPGTPLQQARNHASWSHRAMAGPVKEGVYSIAGGPRGPRERSVDQSGC